METFDMTIGGNRLRTIYEKDYNTLKEFQRQYDYMGFKTSLETYDICNRKFVLKVEGLWSTNYAPRPF